MLKSLHLPKTDLVRRTPFFYGWVVWAAATLGLIATSPGQSFTVSLFFDHFIADFNLDRTTVSSMYGLGTFIASLSLTWVGRQIDRVGNRRASTVIAILFAIVLALWTTVMGPFGLLIGFTAIRGLGQGSLSLSSTTVVAQWFERRRGQVLSLMMVIFSLFQSQYILWLEDMLIRYDWRQVWLILAGIMAVVVVPVSWLLLRNKPEDYNMQPDGDDLVDEIMTDVVEAMPDVADGADPVDDGNWTLSEALRTPIFWIFTLGRVLGPTFGTGLILHQVSLFQSLGHDGSLATATFSQFTLMSAVVAIVFGWLMDRFRPGLMLAVQLGALVATMLLATAMSNPTLVPIYAITFAMVMGSGGVFDGTVWPNLFGRRHQGAIRGFVTTINVIGSAVGPVIFGLSYDLTGNYSAALFVGVALALVPLLLSFFAKPPTRRKQKVA